MRPTGLFVKIAGQSGTRGWVAQAASFAGHALLLLVVGMMARELPRQLAATRTMTIVTIPPLPTSSADSSPALAPERPDAPGMTGEPDLHIGAFTFDIDRIARRRDHLFPFISGDIGFAELEQSIEKSADGFQPRLTAPDSDSTAPPLHLAPADVQAVIDRAWSRRDRWASFAEIRKLIDDFDGDAGDVPLVLRTYLAQNILQPYFESDIPDPRLWVMLALAADHVDFVDYIGAYVRLHPSSKTTTELLLLLDKLVQGNRDALVALLSVDPQSQASFTRTARPAAYDLLVSIRDHYRTVLELHGISSTEQLTARYDETRLRLLTAIMRGSPAGYRVNDAAFLSGVIHWRAGRYEEAVNVWRTIASRPDDAYYAASSRLLPIIGTGGAPTIDARAVKNALDAEDGRWLSTAYDRLHQFGYKFDTY
jgi:hypothetical protein